MALTLTLHNVTHLHLVLFDVIEWYQWGWFWPVVTDVTMVTGSSAAPSPDTSPTTKPLSTPWNQGEEVFSGKAKICWKVFFPPWYILENTLPDTNLTTKHLSTHGIEFEENFFLSKGKVQLRTSQINKPQAIKVSDMKTVRIILIFFFGTQGSSPVNPGRSIK